MQVVTGGLNAVNALMGGVNTGEEVQFFRNSLAGFQSALTNSGVSLDQAYLGQLNQVFDQYNSVEAIDSAKLALGKATGVLSINAVQELMTIDQWQMASPVMQGWLMAEPTINQMYIDGKIDGYSDSWEMSDPNVGILNQQYRQVMNGALVGIPDQHGHEDLYFEHHTFRGPNGELDIDEVDALNGEQQMMIRNSWREAKAYLLSTPAKKRKDITSPWGG